MEALQSDPGFRLVVDRIGAARSHATRKLIGERDRVKLHRLQGNIETYDSLFGLVGQMIRELKPE